MNAAKAAINPTEQPWLETLALLAGYINAHPTPWSDHGCAAGPWADEIAIRASDGVYESYHAVASSGGYTGAPDRDAWGYGEATCGAPAVPPLAKAKVGLFQTSPKRTYDAKFLFGPDVGFCAALGYTDSRAYCPLDLHPDSAACAEAYVGVPKWTWDGVPNGCFPRPNPYMFRCEDGVAGTLTVCDSKAGKTCASIDVTNAGLIRKAAAELSDHTKTGIILVLGYVLDFLKWLW